MLKHQDTYQMVVVLLLVYNSTKILAYNPLGYHDSGNWKRKIVLIVIIKNV